MTAKAKKDDQPFEELYRALEETVDKLEKGGLPLEQSIALYEEGMELAKRCQTVLDDAEQRITKLRDSFAQRSDEEPPEEEAYDEEAVEADEA